MKLKYIKTMVIGSLMLVSDLALGQKDQVNEIVNELNIFKKSTYAEKYLFGFNKTTNGSMERFERNGLFLSFYFDKDNSLDYFITNKIEPTGIDDIDFKEIWLKGAWRKFYFGSSYTVYKKVVPAGGYLYVVSTKNKYNYLD